MSIQELIKEKVLIIDGATGTMIQDLELDDEVWQGKEGFNELLNVTAPSAMRYIHKEYAKAGADLIKTNTFGAMPWVMDEYEEAHKSYEYSKAGAELVKSVCEEFSTAEKPRFVLGSIGPGTKLPSLGHIAYDEMYEGYKTMIRGLVDGGVDVYLLETCQDPLQIKAALHACEDVNLEKGVDIPVMVSVTIELSGTMLIGTDATTIATILEPFDILSLGFNCGTGPIQIKKHVQALSAVWHKPISVHANAGLPQNVGGRSVYPMKDEEFSLLQKEFCEIDGVAFLGGCCGTTPVHINALMRATEGLTPKMPTGSHNTSIASLFNTVELKQEPAPLLIGERSNATGSKAFRELLLAEDYEGTLSVAQQQVRAAAHLLDVSVGFAGRDERKDMNEVVSRYAQKIPLPLMPDSTQVDALETALKLIGGKPIINSVNLEDGIEKFDQVCALAKRYGAALVCLTIDEVGMAKTKTQKLEQAERLLELCVSKHGLKEEDLIFDMLTFTIGSGDDEYRTAGIETMEAIREFSKAHPKVSTTLGLSNISFGLSKEARIYLNSVFLHHCIEAGLTSAIVNVKHILPMRKISEEDKAVCEALIFNDHSKGDPLFAFIDYFKEKEGSLEEENDAEFEKLSEREKIYKLLIDGDKERMLPLVESARANINPELIINEILIEAMKEVGEMFGKGEMQLPFVLQSAETMKSTVDYLNQYLPKKDGGEKVSCLVLGTVKGDVHDVGKNLVDIILSNNGYKVNNLGIKVDIEQFIENLEQNDADAIGMSGLLVKSTQVMKENLEELAKRGIDKPILLGGAALSRNFIDEYCRPIYKGPIFYCKDAFDGVIAMQRISVGNYDTNLHHHEEKESKKIVQEKKVYEVPAYKDIQMPPYDTVITKPPFMGRRILRKGDFKQELAFDWINHNILFKQRWGYARKKMDKKAYDALFDKEVYPAYERLKAQFLEGLFDPIIIYGYFKCRKEENKLYIIDEEGKEHLFDFPRQQKPPFRALTDYYKEDDIVALTCVSAGNNLAEYEAKLYAAGEFKEYYKVHGLGVELAEALAEIVHKQIRLDLDIAKNEGHSLNDVKMVGYQGCRYSFGYPSCPDLAMNRTLFDILKPEEFGIELSETYQIHPEQSTCAIVTYNPEAKYYTL